MAKQFYRPTTTLIELGPEGAHVLSGEIIEISRISRPIVDDTIVIEPCEEATANESRPGQASTRQPEDPSSY